jgi:hypothetical protein
MRGQDAQQAQMFSYLSPEQRLLHIDNCVPGQLDNCTLAFRQFLLPVLLGDYRRLAGPHVPLIRFDLFQTALARGFAKVSKIRSVSWRQGQY